MTTPGRPQWTADGTLYALLMETFPAHHTESGILDVGKLRTDLKKSPEAIYKWLRTSRLSAKNARAIHNLANSETNVAALRKVKRKPPEIRAFDPFVYA